MGLLSRFLGRAANTARGETLANNATELASGAEAAPNIAAAPTGAGIGKTALDGTDISYLARTINLRDLGGYKTPDGPTLPHRFLRSGATRSLNGKDIARLGAWGVTHVLDLRGTAERPTETCAFAHRKGFVWKNVQLYHRDISEGGFSCALDEEFHIRAYLGMLSGADAVRNALSFLAHVPQDECALFHCAAGMDRTGICSMLLLGVAGVSRTDITRDYLLSFATPREVDRYLADGEVPRSMQGRLAALVDTMGHVYDQVVETYGSVADYLLACGLSAEELVLLRNRMLH